MRLTLVVTTYERPDALAAVLTTVAAQSQFPHELIVADDGSGAVTRAIIQRFAAVVPFATHHIRQDHDGFRAARVRNLAIAKATGDYIIFVDGDMLLHPAFVADHGGFARRGTFTQGIRIPLDARRTAQALASPAELPALTMGGAGGLRSLYAVHAPKSSRVWRTVANGFIAVKSCNLAVWRDDLVAVNGFNHDFVGWGPEDKELVARLQHHGIRRQTLLFGGIAYHLHHPPAQRNRLSANEAILANTRARRLVRCQNGLHGVL